ncbi:hypothetical protein MSHRCOH1_05455 [Candidatus Ornithobacterium hominis]|uniref:hypothetical protein n=1 Tax=Candidatus Ornithobacterium hominis TaxID=2497989 RepID=UPI0024BD1CDE|nr:hypothetical protein [Candidatus Ornithobacterium hominis]CAI9429639.1 hypothetical protein MSHRCOH1_05455 [Candidatus Ornithobacterium hominis]
MYLLSKNELSDFVKFVVIENYKHHTAGLYDTNFFSNIKSINEMESMFFDNAKIYVNKNDDQNIVSGVRVLKWNCIDELPIQSLFGINPLEIVNIDHYNSIWHIGRLAINKKCSNLRSLKKILVNAFVDICKDTKSVVFAECDNKLLRVLERLNIEIIRLGRSKKCLGSLTTPICIMYEGLINFYNKNKHLLSFELVSNSSKIGTYTKV